MTNGHPSNPKNNSKNQGNFGICLPFKFPKVSLNASSYIQKKICILYFGLMCYIYLVT